MAPAGDQDVRRLEVRVNESQIMEVHEPLRHVQHAFHRLCGCGHPGREHGLQVGATVHVDEVRHAPDREAVHQPHDESMAAHVRDHGFLMTS